MLPTALLRVLLLAYPPSLRRAHGAEMIAAVDEGWRARRGVVARIGFLFDLIRDFLATWPREWGLVGRRSPDHQPARSPRDRATSTVRLATRLLLRAPLFSVAAVLTLALGIGASVAVFSLANATILHPLPVPQAERVLQAQFSWSYPDFRDASAMQRVFSHVAAWTSPSFAVERDGATTEVDGAGVSGDYFALAGQRAVAGRLISPADDTPGAPPVAVVSERFWRRDLGSDPALIGSTVSVNRRPVTIVGIAPARFRGFSLQSAPDIFVSLTALPELSTGFLSRPGILTNRGAVWLSLVGRLAPDVEPSQAEVEFSRIYRQLHPPKPGNAGDDDPVFVAVVARAVGLDRSDDLARFVFVLLAATSVTLLLTGATVANLLLMRAERRRRELAVHAALGASRGALARMLFVESLVLGGAGAVAGLGVATIALQFLGVFALPGQILIGDLDLTLDRTMFAMAAALGLGTAIIFGLAPTWRVMRLDVTSTMRDGGSRATSRQPLRTVLVGLQVALCVLLLGGSVAFGRALRFALGHDLGFNTSDTTLTAIAPSLARYRSAQVLDFNTRSLEALRAQPAVRAAAWSAMRPLRGTMMWSVGVQDAPETLTTPVDVHTNVVSPGYFDAMGIPIREGRDFGSADTSEGPGAIVVSASMARNHWPDRSAIGRQIALEPVGSAPREWATVVGVVEDVHRAIDGPALPMIYLTFAQMPQVLDFGGEYLITRTSGRADAAARDVLAVLRQVDPQMPISRSETMRAHMEQQLMAHRLGLTLFALFAGLAIVLTGLGLHAVIAYAIAQRTREIGVRVALGAGRASVVGLVFRQAGWPVAAGLVVGALTYTVSSAALEQFMFGLPANAPLMLVVVALGVGAMAIAAMVVPARRALSIDPAAALRNE